MVSENWKSRVVNLLERGFEVDHIPQVTSEEMAQGAVDLFIYTARQDCRFLLDQTIVWANSSMATLAVAVLLTNAPDKFLQNEIIKSAIAEILITKNPDQLLEMVTLIRSKGLGKGLGSRSQKLVRRVMENWSSAQVLGFFKEQPKSLYALVRLIHPRYTDERGEIIIELTQAQR